MEDNWRHKKVQTFRPVRAVKKNIPSGWRGEVISQYTTPSGKIMLAVVWENTGEEISVYTDEVEVAQ